VNGSFFPHPLWAWVFLFGVAGPLAVAAWIDWKTLRVPKPLVIGLFFGGLLMHLLRGAFMGVYDLPVWMFGQNGALIGAFDGLMFALAGFVTGFGLFFLLWLFGACGGGDVKLAAALGAWLGPQMLVGAVVFSLVVVTVLTIGTAAAGMLTDGLRKQAKVTSADGKVRRRLMSYSLPLAIATVGILLIAFQQDFGLTAPALPK
jgi:Flp pilus assembly protein protease CpaA